MPGDQLLELALLIIKAFIRLLYSPLFWLVAFLVVYQFGRSQKDKEELFGLKGEAGRQNYLTIGAGLLGGLLGSFLMVAVGLSLTGIGIIWLWPAALLLMLISPRLLCFSYAGGLISLSNLIFGYPQIDIPQLMGLVAILHLVEATLIFFSGHLGAMPVYIRPQGGRVVGAFNLQKFWPIPLVALAAVVLPTAETGSGFVNMPDWWPMIKPAAQSGVQTVYQLLPVVAAVGYGDLAVASLPRARSRWAACHLFIFSFLLLGLAIIASREAHFVIIAALFAPLGHEIVIFLGQKGESQIKSPFIQPAQGVMVLDVLPGSPAARLGLKLGDTVLTVNDLPVNNKEDFFEALETSLGLVDGEWLPYGQTKMVSGQVRKNMGQAFGVLLAPQANDSPVTEFTSEGILGRWLKRFAKRVLRQLLHVLSRGE